MAAGQLLTQWSHQQWPSHRPGQRVILNQLGEVRVRPNPLELQQQVLPACPCRVVSLQAIPQLDAMRRRSSPAPERCCARLSTLPRHRWAHRRLCKQCDNKSRWMDPARLLFVVCVCVCVCVCVILQLRPLLPAAPARAVSALCARAPSRMCAGGQERQPALPGELQGGAHGSHAQRPLPAGHAL